MKLYRHLFRVEVSSSFPIDMLRYDGMYPHEETDSYKIIGSFNDNERRSVYLAKISREREPRYTVRRWESFGCNIEHLPSERREIL